VVDPEQIAEKPNLLSILQISSPAHARTGSLQINRLRACFAIAAIHGGDTGLPNLEAPNAGLRVAALKGGVYRKNSSP
jgi:hypothetical protein